MKIVIIGPGAIGCLLAGLLAEAGSDVWLLDKEDGARARAISERGIQIDGCEGSRIVRVKISAETSVVGRAPMVFVCVKSYDVAVAIRHALPLVGNETTVVPLANGWGNAEKISEVVEARQIVCGITSHGSTSLGPGHVRHAGAGPTAVAAFVTSERERAEGVADVLSSSGLEAVVSDDMSGMIWNKLIVNAAINPLSAILGVPNGRLLEDDEARMSLRGAALEAAEVARAMGVNCVCADPVLEAEKVCLDTAHNISSMLQDIRRGRRTEVEAITGMIVKEGRAVGVPVPVNEMLLARVRALERENARRREKQEA